jgi:hypothetical protein
MERDRSGLVLAGDAAKEKPIAQGGECAEEGAQHSAKRGIRAGSHPHLREKEDSDECAETEK